MLAKRRCNHRRQLAMPNGPDTQLSVLVELRAIEDPYLRERRHDVVQVVERVLKVFWQAGHVRSANAESTRSWSRTTFAADVIQFKNPLCGFPTDLAGYLTHRDRRAPPHSRRSWRPPRARADPGERLLMSMAVDVVIVNPDRWCSPSTG